MPRRALLLATALAACSPEPQVEVLTRSGPETEQARAWADSFELWAARLASLGERELDAQVADLPPEDVAAPAPARRRKRPPKAEAPGPEEQVVPDMPEAPGLEAQPVAPPRSSAELADLVAALQSAPHRDLPPLARALAGAPAELWPELRPLLLAPRKARKADYKAFLAQIGGDVPNRYGHFELAWKRAHGYTVRLSEDWFEDLLALPSSKVSKIFRGIHRDAVLTAALLRAASSIGADPARTEDVVDALLAAAYVHEGTFRDEVGRALRRLGDPAVPTLLLRSVRPALPADEKKAQEVKDSLAYKTAEYAGYQVDRMDRSHPRKALAAVRDEPRRLAELLAAYGVVRPGDAAAPILDHVDSPIPRVREAARAAFLAYVTGPAPRAERKVVRLLGGGTSEAPALPTYRDMARVAILGRLADERSALHEPDCRSARKDSPADPTCEQQPERLARAYFAGLDDQRREREHAQIAAALAEPDCAAAIAMLDVLLADDPALSARAELVPTYEAAAAEAGEAGDLATSARLYRKSAALLVDSDPARADELRARALLAEAELAATPEGRGMLLATAQTLVPDDPELQARLAESAERPATAAEAALPVNLAQRTGMAAGALALLFALGSLFTRWRVRT